MGPATEPDVHTGDHGKPSNLTADVAVLTVDMREVKKDVKGLHKKMDLLLRSVGRFLTGITKEEEERKSADVQLERRVVVLEKR